MSDIGVLVSGALGRMGRQVVSAVAAADGMSVVAAVDTAAAGEDAGVAAGVGALEVQVQPSLSEALETAGVDVAVDFTAPAAVADNIRVCLLHDTPAVVGTTGLGKDDLAELRVLADERDTPVFIAPNFAIGAVMMMMCARLAARWFDQAEIIEYHHDRKLDAPSGTALRTAELMVEARGSEFDAPAVETEETLSGCAGGRWHGIRLHSVRLPGVIANQAVILGGQGQTLTLRHDTTSRESFMPGVVLAIRRVRDLRGVVVGLENLLE